MEPEVKIKRKRSKILFFKGLIRAIWFDIRRPHSHKYCPEGSAFKQYLKWDKEWRNNGI